MVKYLITGMSHVRFLRRAAKDAGDTEFRFEIIKPAFATPRGRFKIAMAAKWRRLRYGPDVLCLLLGGNVHISLACSITPSRSPLIPQRVQQFIPSNMMRAGIEQRYAVQFALSDKIAAACPRARRLVVSALPPLSDPDDIRRYAGSFRPNLAQGVAPEAHRLALFQLQAEVFETYAAQIGAGFVTPPPGTLIESCQLATPFARLDPTHANPAYGVLMLDRIRAAAKERL